MHLSWRVVSVRTREQEYSYGSYGSFATHPRVLRGSASFAICDSSDCQTLASHRRNTQGESAFADRCCQQVPSIASSARSHRRH